MDSTRRTFLGVLAGGTVLRSASPAQRAGALDLEDLCELVRLKRWDELYSAVVHLRMRAERGEVPSWADAEALRRVPLRLSTTPEIYFRSMRRESYERTAEVWNADEMVISARPLVWQDFAEEDDLRAFGCETPWKRAAVILVGPGPDWLER